jgi:hypothetical protein
MSIKDDIGASKFHPILGPCKVAEENLINDIPGRIFVYAGDPDAPEIFHVAEGTLRDVCVKCDGERVSDMGGYVVPCDACKGKGYV